eukprot:CAMPEP_0196825598 /NCGR_PEP_ID=MMETSP1362-20130617/93145_1 /TAXON_ID=163516 /ORGANISM="Leptocylindrus danicus, Strain CCMP1856" /LENGTH=742 /DNA_ID=CAMNT_0042206053 /DNA_START=220 /DNA_END=2445 /DNA_ORIENTATION=+
MSSSQRKTRSSVSLLRLFRRNRRKTVNRKANYVDDWQKRLDEVEVYGTDSAMAKANEDLKGGRTTAAFMRYCYANHQDILKKDKDDRERVKLRNQMISILDDEYPESSGQPTMNKLVNVILNSYELRAPDKEKNPEAKWVAKYKVGDWVEILDHDMEWRLHEIKQKHVEDFDGDGIAGDEDFETSYDVGSEKGISTEKMRCSEAGLKRLFGVRPWVWQQYALLKVETKIRFQQDHRDDFCNFDIMGYTEELWDLWLNNPDNFDFKKLYDNSLIGESGRRSLKTHILKPFELMTALAKGDPDWDVTCDEMRRELGVFTYLSFLGDGFIFPFVVFGLQLAIPMILVYTNWDYFSWKQDWDTQKGEVEWDKFFERARCILSPLEKTENLKLASLMALVVQVLYLVQVTPDTITNFYLQVGNAGRNVFQKLKSIRMRIRDKKHDRMGQNVGYTLDLVMNTLYVCVLYMINIFNVLQNEDTFELLLNCLALIFVAHIDEEFAGSLWWDVGMRWIKAASVELVLQNYINKPALKSTKLFAKRYNMNLDVLLEVSEGDKRLFKNRYVAEKDRKDTSLMTTRERVDFMCSELAMLTRNPSAILDYCKQQHYFGEFEFMLMKHIYGALNWIYPDVKLTGGVFNRYELYRTWSRWNDILYIGNLPDINSVLMTITAVDTVGVETIDGIDRDDEPNEDWNFDPDFTSSMTYFWTETFFSTLTLQELMGKIKDSLLEARVNDVIFWIYDAFFEW